MTKPVLYLNLSKQCLQKHPQILYRGPFQTSCPKLKLDHSKTPEKVCMTRTTLFKIFQ